MKHLRPFYVALLTTTSNIFAKLFVPLPPLWQRKKIKDNLKLEAFPEEITEDGIRIYGETSYENQMAVLSHYLHNNQAEVDDEKKEEIILAIREFLSRKQFRQPKNEEELTDEQIWMAAESPLQYNLFDDFFKVPFPAPENPRFTFIHSHNSHNSHSSHYAYR